MNGSTDRPQCRQSTASFYRPRAILPRRGSVTDGNSYPPRIVKGPTPTLIFWPTEQASFPFRRGTADG